MAEDSQAYKDKKARFDQMITVYGRNVVLEMLYDKTVLFHKVHLSSSNRQEGVILEILDMAKQRDIEVKVQSKEQLSRISKNSKQDQGVAADIMAPNYLNAKEITKRFPDGFRLLALDGIQNPQNLGMIIRSAAAGNIDGIILPKDRSAKLSPLVIKASAGTLFKIDIFYTPSLAPALKQLSDEGSKVYALSSHAKEDIYSVKTAEKSIFVLGNESEGVSDEVQSVCNASLSIPMQREVESLNVAVTAALIAFMRS